MADRIFVEHLRVKCTVGVTPEERREPQEVILDVSLFLNLKKPATSGRLEDTVNYRELMERVSAVASGSEYVLLEALADGVASTCLRDPRIGRVVVRARKSKYSADPSVGVEVERG